MVEQVAALATQLVMHFEVESDHLFILIKTTLSKNYQWQNTIQAWGKNLLNEVFEKNAFGSIVFDMSLVIAPI